MDLAINTSGAVTTLHVSGAIDERGAEQLKTQFNQLSLAGRQEVAFDFGGVSHIGSAGLGKLLLFYKKLSSAGVHMSVGGLSPELRQLMAELRLDTLFKVS